MFATLWTLFDRFCLSIDVFVVISGSLERQWNNMLENVIYKRLYDRLQNKWNAKTTKQRLFKLNARRSLFVEDFFYFLWISCCCFASFCRCLVSLCGHRGSLYWFVCACVPFVSPYIEFLSFLCGHFVPLCGQLSLYSCLFINRMHSLPLQEEEEADSRFNVLTEECLQFHTVQGHRVSICRAARWKLQPQICNNSNSVSQEDV